MDTPMWLDILLVAAGAVVAVTAAGAALRRMFAPLVHGMHIMSEVVERWPRLSDSVDILAGATSELAQASRLLARTMQERPCVLDSRDTQMLLHDIDNRLHREQETLDEIKDRFADQEGHKR